jgi:hypothetical protein
MRASDPPAARNRVTPLGEIIAVGGRGAWMGNRGVLHVGDGTRDIVRTYRNRAWITCALSFKDRRLPQWQSGHYTQLFFLDEAVALSAGHRPCAECRRAEFNAYRSAWAAGHGQATPKAPELDAQLHLERRPTEPPDRRTHLDDWAGLPDGVFARTGCGPAVVVGDALVVWDPSTNSYGARRPRPRSGPATVITPPSNVAVLRAGYPVQIDPAARP